jgi:hypothetical protein
VRFFRFIEQQEKLQVRRGVWIFRITLHPPVPDDIVPDGVDTDDSPQFLNFRSRHFFSMPGLRLTMILGINPSEI